MHRIRLAAPAAVIAVSLLFLGQAPAGAETPAPPDTTTEEVAAIANAAAGAPAPAATESSSSVIADAGTAEVEIPLDPGAGFEVDPGTGPAVNIGVPGDETGNGTAIDGNVVYSDVAPDTAVVARPTTEGVQALIVIDGADAPTSYRFPIDVGAAGAELQPRPDGSVEVRQPGATEPTALVMPAWATDANGEPVPTHFAVDGNTLIQVVDHQGAAYPVVADPNTCGTVTCTYYFSKTQTKDMSTITKAAALCAFLLKFPIAAAGCGAAAGVVAYQADRAKNRGMCLKIKYTKVGVTVWWPDIYSGKYCK